MRVERVERVERMKRMKRMKRMVKRECVDEWMDRIAKEYGIKGKRAYLRYYF
jgi:hypothetical protein